MADDFSQYRFSPGTGQFGKVGEGGQVTPIPADQVPEAYRLQKLSAKPAASEKGIVGKALGALPQDPFQQAAPSRKELGTPAWLGERGAEIGLGALGGLGGAAAGALTAPFTGPAGAFAGEAAGSTGGLTLADAINSAVNRHLLGQKGAPITAANLEQAAKANLAGSLIGGAAGKVLGPLASRFIGKPGLEAAARAGEEAGAGAATGAQEAFQTGRQALGEKAAQAVEGAKGTVAEQVRPEAVQEAMQRSLGRTPAETAAAQALPRTATGDVGPEMLARRKEFSDTMSSVMGLGDKRGALVNEDVPPEFWAKMQGINEPTDAMKEITATPQRFMAIASRASPEQGAILRREFADAVNLKKIKLNEGMRPALGKLGFKGTLTKPEAWDKAGQTLQYLPDMLAQNPRAAARYDSLLRDSIGAAREIENQGIIDLATKQAAGLPADTREGIMRSINAAGTSQEKADAALQAFGAMDPRAAGQQKAVEAIMGYKPNQGMVGRMIQRRMRRGLLMPATMGTAMALGHPVSAVPIASMAAIGGGYAIRQGMQKAWLHAIQESPEAAGEFYKAMVNPGTEGNLAKITKRIVDASLASASVHHQTGGSDEEEPPLITDRTHSPGPMGKEIERQKATAIATARGQQDPRHLDQLQSLDKDVSKGKAPNIHKDLNSGRLAPDEVRRLVENNPAALAQMFDGMGLDDAMNAFQQGTPEEKEMALPALVQHMQNQGQKLDPAQRRALLLRLKKALPGMPDDQQQAPAPPPEQGAA